LHIDCTEQGASPPTAMEPTCICLVGFFMEGHTAKGGVESQERRVVALPLCGLPFVPTTPSIHIERALPLFNVSSGITRLFFCARSPAYLSCPSLGPPPAARAG